MDNCKQANKLCLHSDMKDSPIPMTGLLAINMWIHIALAGLMFKDIGSEVKHFDRHTIKLSCQY